MQEGSNGAPQLDVMLLKQLSLFGPDMPAIQYLYRRTHPLLQFLLQKLAEWIAENLGDRLNLLAGAGSNDDWSAQQLNLILQRCLLPDGRAKISTRFK